MGETYGQLPDEVLVTRLARLQLHREHEPTAMAGLLRALAAAAGRVRTGTARGGPLLFLLFQGGTRRVVRAP